MNKIIVVNLKSHLKQENIKDYIEILNKDNYNNLVICPPYNYLNLFKSNNYVLGSQNIESNYLDLFNKNDVKYSIVGHYDYIKSGENNFNVNKKIKLCSDNNIKSIVCIGLDKFDENKIKSQINDYIDGNDLNDIIIAYEPYNLIGTDEVINIIQIQDQLNFIKNYIFEKYNFNIKVLYGGNVNEKNIEEILNMSDGILVSRFAINIENFTKILKKYNLI